MCGIAGIFDFRGRGEVDPQDHARRWIQPGAVDPRRLFGPAVAVDEDGVHDGKRRAR